MTLQTRPGAASNAHADRVHYETVSLCPVCGTLVPGAVVERSNGVFVTRTCAAHGAFDGLVCSDVAWWNSLPRFDVEPVRPAKPAHETVKGCPEDCGLCPAHKQIAGTVAIEISNRCNAKCPVCLADNKETFELTVDDVSREIERFLEHQRKVDVVTLSGGEPTIHPQLFDIIRVLDRPEISRIAVNSNGLRIARDDEFLDRLAREKKVYVNLHFDGPGARAIRGVNTELQETALRRLCERGIAVVPIVLATQGVNDTALGDVVVSLLKRAREVKAVVLSMMTYTGSRGGKFPGDPLARLTIPGALDRIEEGSAGVIRKRDFIPLPMPNPMCAAVGYFLVDADDVTPLLPLGDLDRVVAAMKNSNFLDADEDVEALLRDAIDRVFAAPERFPNGDRLLGKLRALLLRLFPRDRVLTTDSRRSIVEEHVKTVYLMQFMDAWTFDSKRLAKCSCQHLLPGGSVVPSCGYYSYHRRFDPRFAGATLS